MATHATIDLETLDVKPSTVVLTLGAVKFDPLSTQEPYSELYFRFEIDSQLQENRTVNDSTLEWWSRQDAKVQEEAFSDGDRVEVASVLDQLRKWMVGVDVLWGQGYGFDMTILEDLYRQNQTPVPWNFWQVRDSRTLFKCCKDDPRKQMQTDLHNALADAYFQSKAIQIAYKELSIKK